MRECLGACVGVYVRGCVSVCACACECAYASECACACERACVIRIFKKALI